jgi:formate hydrogenlyase subunit 4
MTAATILIHIALLLLTPPLFLGVIQRVKALAAGRTGTPLLQPYYDLARLFRKGAVYSVTTTWLFRAGPVVSLAATLCAGLLVPLHAGSAPLGFPGDVIALAGLLGLARFATILAALDTGSSFEGMGASREAGFGALAEPALYLGLAIVCLPARTASIGMAWGGLPWETWGAAHPAMLAAAGALFIFLLAENARIPVDDPTTHLELTMIHEVMVLDHGGPDLGFILYGSAVKLFLVGALLVHLLLPVPLAGGPAGVAVLLAGQLLVAITIGVLESSVARLRLPRVPQFVIGASVLAALGLVALFYRGGL